MGPVHSPAAVTIPFKNTANKKTTPKATEQTKPKPNKKQAPKRKHQTTKEESDRRSSSVTIDGKGGIALYQPKYWYGKN